MKTYTEIQVRYGETDCMGVVYHPNYLPWFELGRTDFLEKIGYPYKSLEDSGYMAPVIHAELDYSNHFVYGDTAVVETTIVKLSPVRSSYAYRVFKKGEDPETAKPSVTGLTQHCFVEKGTFKVVPTKKAMPEFHEALQKALEA